MINDLIQYFKDKKVLILGFGKEGQSTYNLIRRYLKEQHLYIADRKKDFYQSFELLKKDNNITCISGEHYIENLQDYDIVMKSPGVSFAYIDTTQYIHKIKSQLELLLEFFDVLIYKILADQNVKSMLLGNIGVPIFDYIDTIQEDMTLVLEMSSHQLEYTELSPNIAILLNIYAEHLDHYESFENYAMAKCNIFKYQKKADYFLYNTDIEILNKLAKDTNGTTYKVSFNDNYESNIYLKENNIYFNDIPIYDKNEPRNLVGDYNLNNIMFVLAVSEILKLDINKTIKSISEFKTLEHRLEFVGEYNGILYYDNSIGTVPKATIEAVEALKNVDTLIIGGMDRGIDYTDFIEYLNESNISNIICMPKTGHDIAKKLTEEKRHIVNSLEDAVCTAKNLTKKGKICLLSPTAASYGFFKNFEEKGNLYKKLVKST